MFELQLMTDENSIMMVSHAVYWTLLILSCFEQFSGQGVKFLEPANGAVGGRVEFTPDNPPSTWTETEWSFKGTFIISAVPGSALINPAYVDRVSFNIKTLSLELWNLTLEDSGIYKLSLVTNLGLTFTGETLLQMFEIISDVQLTGPEESLIEGESSLNITSEGSGSITSVQWMKDLSPLSPSDRIIFSSNNRSVSISPVQRSDTGEYQCTYRNPVSFETGKLNLIINYGPEDVSVKGPDVENLGVKVSLICSANSAPSPSFSWTFNGSDTDVTTDTFTIDETDFTHSGDYSCTAWNNVTMRNASQTHALLVKALGGGGLTAGAIAGIVIGVLVAVAGICGLIVYLTKTKKIPKIKQKQKGQAWGAAENKQKTDSKATDIQKKKGAAIQEKRRSEPNIYENTNPTLDEDEIYENVV